MSIRTCCLFLIALISALDAKAILIARNVSDCSITEDGILLYHGKHSYTRFHHECLPWQDLQTVYSELITEPNFITDSSIRAAKNFCRNPNLNPQGPWCFVEDGDEIRMEECGVCQSLKPQPSTETDESDDTQIVPIHRNFFQQFQDEFKRYALYFREKVREILRRVRNRAEQLRARFMQYWQ